jgi:predicted O-methyltransferase YrrM
VKLEWRDVEIGGVTINTSLTAAETAELQRLAAGKRVLEVGSAYGYSTVALASVAAKVTAVDPHLWLNSLETLEGNLASAGVAHKVKIIRGDSRAVLPRLALAGPMFDMVWVDGDHAAEVVASDVEWAVKLLHPGGTLACHDYGEDTCPGVRSALDAWKVPPRLVDTLAVYEDLR